MPTAVVFNRIPQVIAQISERTKVAVDDTARDIQQRASSVAPRDTGSLAASIYVNNGDQSDYPQRTGDAQARNRNVVILEEIDPEFVIPLLAGNASYSTVVGVAAGHGVFQELGTRFQPPQPFLIGSAEATSDDFMTRMSHVADI